MKKRFLIIFLLIALTLSGGGFAYTYTTAGVTTSATDMEADIATCNTTATQPDWESILPGGTETLRPDDAGDDTNISSQEPDSGAHWEKVDDVTADDFSTYVYTNSTSYQRDLYSIPDPTEDALTINNVTVYYRFANSATAAYAIAYEGLSTDGFLKTVEIATDGQITDTVIDTLEFDTSDTVEPDIIHISGNVYAMAYQGAGTDGFLKTVEITTGGQITDPVIDTLEFDTSNGAKPDIIHVSGNVYAIAYEGALLDGSLTTVEIATNGQITDPVIDTLVFADVGVGSTMIHISGNVYAIAYKGAGSDGWMTTVEIATNGQITDLVIDTLEFDTVNGVEPDIINVSGNVYAIAYKGVDNDGFLTTVEIATNGQITDTAIDALEFDTDNGVEPDIINVSGNVYAIVYQGTDNDGFLKTVEIATNGQITDMAIDALMFDATNGAEPEIISVAGDIYVIAYEGPGSDGWMTTVEIATDGEITDAVIDTLEFDIIDGFAPSIILVSGVPGNVYAKAAIKTHGTVYTGDAESTDSNNFTTNSHEWTTNPNTGSAWTWSEVDALQIGVELKTDITSDRAACTQVYIGVNYGGEAGKIWGDVPTGDLYDVTVASYYPGDIKVEVYLTNTDALKIAYPYLNIKLYLEGSVEAGQTPNYQVLTLNNGVATFNLESTGGGTYTLSVGHPSAPTVTGGSYYMTSDDPSEWDAGYSVTPEFYCEASQR